MLSEIKNIAVFVSGNGTGLQTLLDAEKNKFIKNGTIKLVVSSKSTAYALERAAKSGVDTFVSNRADCKNLAEFEAPILKKLDEYDIDLIVLAGFLTVLSKDFIKKYKRRIINIHPSLIPSFCGKGFYGLKVHQSALDYGIKVTGATAHFVDETVDGGEIIMQKAVKILKNDTAEILQKRVMKFGEWYVLPRVVELVCKNIIKKSQEDAEITDLETYLSENSYPGRGIIIGKTFDGANDVVAYFIMGRSVNSRNRVFAEDGSGLKTAAFDESKLIDPSLVIYSPVKMFGDTIIVTNGDQTDTIYNFFEEEKTFEEALNTRKYEPDEPNYTPRISAAVYGDNYKLSILKRENGECVREYFEYQKIKGIGHFIHTYKCDGNPIPSYEGEPKIIQIPTRIDEFANIIWNSLNNENKVSLFVRYTNIKTKAAVTRILNKNEGA